MARIRVNRAHSMSRDEARAVAEEVARELSDDFGLDYRWDGDRMEFRRTGAHGHLDVRPERVEIQLYLEMLLMPMRKKIERSMHRRLDAALR